MVGKSARSLSSSYTSAMSCTVKTTFSTRSYPRGMAPFTVAAIDLPSGTQMTISSARIVSPLLSARASGNSSNGTSHPSPRLKERSSSSCSGSGLGRNRLTTSWASVLRYVGAPILTSKTTPPHRGSLARAQPAICQGDRIPEGSTDEGGAGHDLHSGTRRG